MNSRESRSTSIDDLRVDHGYSVTPGGPRAAEVLKEMERHRVERRIVVPTDDKEVRIRLRELGEPITTFGEDKADRRDRLRRVLGDRLIQNNDTTTTIVMDQEGDVEMGEAQQGEEQESQEEEEEEFYTPGSDSLLAARKFIASFSLSNARKRRARQIAESKISLKDQIRFRRSLASELASYDVWGSQICASRPVSIVRCRPDSQMIAAGSWSGSIELLGIPNLESSRTLRGHTDRVGGIGWHPGSGISQTPSTVNLASGGGEGSVRLWNLEQDTAMSVLEGHEARVCRTAFHPSGRYVGSASFDYTWRLWDIETCSELLLQEGHSKEVYALAFQQDGALAASGGLDAIGRVWDLRTGRTTMVLDGHIREIYALDFSPNGYQVLSGSSDGAIKVWDIRQVKNIYTIPAHKSVVSDLRFFNNLQEQFNIDSPSPFSSGSFLVSSGYDGFINIWSSDNWQLIKSLKGHADRPMSTDVASNGKYIVSSGWDRSVKLWTSENNT